jgi:hypothetical protein
MKKFEYMTWYFSWDESALAEEPIHHLNELGQEGWEVCSQNGGTFLLKRVMP